MKLSISVPDELWEQATRLHPKASTSGLVQRALTEMLARHAAAQVERPAGPEASRALEEARAQVKAKTADLFAQGYLKGLSVVGDLDLRLLEWWDRVGTLAVVETHVESPELTMGDGFEQLGDALVRTLGENWESLYGPEDESTPSRALIAGIDLAMRDVLRVDDSASGGPV